MFGSLKPGVYITNGTETKSIDGFASLLDDGGQTITGRVDIEELASSVAWLYACFKILSDKVSRLPREITTPSEDVVEEEDLPLDINLTDLLWRTEYSRNLYAAAYWYKLRNRRTVAGVRWFDPVSIEPLVSGNEGLVGFKRRLQHGHEVYPVVNGESDVMWFWLPGLREAEPGIAPASVVQTASEVLRSIDQFSDKFFDQGAMPFTLLKIPAGTSDAERDRLEDRFNRFVSGVRNAFKPVAVKSSVEVERISFAPSELAMKELSDTKRDEILAATGIPLSLLLGNAANYATANQDAQNLIEDTISPHADAIADVINRQLLKKLGYRLEFHPERLAIMQEDKGVQATQFLTLVQGNMNPVAAAYFAGYNEDDLPDGVMMFEEPEPVPEPLQQQQPEPAQQGGDPESQALNEKAADLKRWQRKATKAIKGGESADVPFVSDYIPEAEAEEIRGLLAEALSAEEVKAAFELYPFLGGFDKGYP